MIRNYEVSFGQSTGGFESTLADLQSTYSRELQANEDTLKALQAAISQMFFDMNKTLMENRWEFQQYIQQSVGKFLTRFDAIFSLNQDVLLEHHYFPKIPLIGRDKWTGAHLPGMHRVSAQDPMDSASWARSTRYPEAENAFKLYDK